MRASEKKSFGPGIDPRLRLLLDHIAAELAEEYVQLMEQAAESELARASTATTPDNEGDPL